MTKVAYIIVGWNNKDLLTECVDSIVAQDHSDKLIIYIDNDSKDDSEAFVRNKYPNVTVFQVGYNSGFAKANNVGIEIALKDPVVKYIVLLNSDARLDPKWTSSIVSFADKKPKAALLQGTTLDYYNHSIIDSTHIYMSRNGQGTQAHWRYYYTSEFGPKRVFGVNAAACVITRNFIEAQPFGDQILDERLFMYLEDVDLVTRAVIMGWDNYLVPGARAFHMGSASSGKNPGYSLYMTFRNNSAVLVKNYPFAILFKIIPKIIRSDIDTIRTLRRTDRKQMVKKVLKGRIVGMLRSSLYLYKRHKLRKHRAVSNNELWRLMRKGY